jgi:hypothetical protein
MQPFLLITNGFFNVSWQFKFKTDGTELLATDANNHCFCCTNNVRLQVGGNNLLCECDLKQVKAASSSIVVPVKSDFQLLINFDYFLSHFLDFTKTTRP